MDASTVPSERAIVALAELWALLGPEALQTEGARSVRESWRSTNQCIDGLAVRRIDGLAVSCSTRAATLTASPIRRPVLRSGDARFPTERADCPNHTRPRRRNTHLMSPTLNA